MAAWSSAKPTLANRLRLSSRHAPPPRPHRRLHRPLHPDPGRQAAGPGWVHEIKHDGYRLIVRRDGTAVRLFTRRGYDWTDRYPAIAAAAAKLRAKSFTLDGEAVVCGADGVAIFDALHRRHKTAASRPDIRNGPITPCIALTDASREKVAIFGQSIPRSRHDPKILGRDDAEVVGDRIAEVRPIARNLFAQETERRVGELRTGCVAFVVRNVSVHQAP
jgi:ATP dependent DNA ligase domain